MVRYWIIKNGCALLAHNHSIVKIFNSRHKSLVLLFDQLCGAAGTGEQGGIFRRRKRPFFWHKFFYPAKTKKSPFFGQFCSDRNFFVSKSWDFSRFPEKFSVFAIIIYPLVEILLKTPEKSFIDNNNVHIVLFKIISSCIIHLRANVYTSSLFYTVLSSYNGILSRCIWLDWVYDKDKIYGN